MKKPYPLVISAFPGTGKTYATEKLRLAGLTVSDSDSSLWPKENFPANYIKHISEIIADGTHDVIFVSSHDIVRTALEDACIFHILMYPSIESKVEYMCRYKERGSPQGFIDLLSEKWDEWIGAMDSLELEFPDRPLYRAAIYRMAGDGLCIHHMWPFRVNEMRAAVEKAMEEDKLFSNKN